MIFIRQHDFFFLLTARGGPLSFVVTCFLKNGSEPQESLFIKTEKAIKKCLKMLSQTIKHKFSRRMIVTQSARDHDNVSLNAKKKLEHTSTYSEKKEVTQKIF